MKLNFNLSFQDLYNRESLIKIDNEFLAFLKEVNEELYQELLLARDTKIADESKLIILLAPILEEFVAKLFFLENEFSTLKKEHLKLNNIYKARKLFVQRKVAKAYSKEEAKDFFNSPLEGESKLQSSFGGGIGATNNNAQNASTPLQKSKIFTSPQGGGFLFDELEIANYICEKLDNKEEIEEELIKYSAYQLYFNDKSILFSNHKKLDFTNLIDKEEIKIRDRKGFSLTDTGPTRAKALLESNYCVICHDRKKDSCSTGLKDKEGNFKENHSKTKLTGCPMEEKISEMNFLKNQGLNLSSLATAMIDNPMLAATGDRICNDCMKSCIYQTQEPVNIPQIESQILKDCLNLPYGVEIYSLLTRWNPLNFSRPFPRKNSNKKILIAGQGPSGFNLAYNLLQDGHIIAAIDGLKIEPIAKETLENPIENLQTFFEDLDKRAPKGFGGVAEYGITVRWNKNYLSLIQLILTRNNNYKLYGGVRFGSQIDRKIAFDTLGFDHIALCMGAGSPTIINLKNNLANGVRKASDFLMALQAGGAFRKESIANLQIRLPIVVIGGGLTAIDTATESLAYYIRQIEKFSQSSLDLEILTKDEKEIALEFREHHKLISKAKNYPDKLEIIKKLGGVKILYRKSLQDSPAYRLNHEEIEKAFEEGIEFIEHTSPKEVILDEYSRAKAINTICQSPPLQEGVPEGGAGYQDKKTFPARTILIAAGTKPNTILAQEDEKITTENLYFQSLNHKGEKQILEVSCKDKNKDTIFTYFAEDGRSISYFGDMHQNYAGNVVKAMASAKNGFPLISQNLPKTTSNPKNNKDFFANLDSLLEAKIVKVITLAPNIIEIIVHSPLAAQNFKPGQFYKLQNFEIDSITQDNKILAIEPIALTGASVDLAKGNISLIALEIGNSSRLCSNLKSDQKVILMGPTGEPTEILKDKKIMLIGGGLGNAVLFSIGKAMRANGCQTLYFAGYKKAQDRYKIAEIEKAADTIIWACDEESDFKPNRKQDFTFQGNIIESIEFYAQQKNTKIKLQEIDHIIAIGSDGMMNAVKQANNTILKKHLTKNPVAIASINSPMQCMMKEICASCLQKHIDPKTKQEYFVYSCNNQDQNMDTVDFRHLRSRLKQNSLLEKSNTIFY